MALSVRNAAGLPDRLGWCRPWPENREPLAAILETGAAKQTLIMAADPDHPVA